MPLWRALFTGRGEPGGGTDVFADAGQRLYRIEASQSGFECVLGKLAATPIPVQIEHVGQFVQKPLKLTLACGLRQRAQDHFAGGEVAPFRWCQGVQHLSACQKTLPGRIPQNDRSPD